MIRKFFLILYYGLAYYLPDSYLPIVGPFSNFIRILCVKHIFKKCGIIRTINRKAYFGNGIDCEIGDFSSIGANCNIPNNTLIGNNVLMAPDIHIVKNNHEFKDVTKPIGAQGPRYSPPTIIEDDCWIGIRCLFTPGHKIGKGSIIGAGSVVTKDVESFSIVAGNPARLIKKRV